MLGSALTVRVRPGDNLMILKAMQMARPGDVLVIDGSADLTRAVFGGIMRAMALIEGRNCWRGNQWRSARSR